MHRLDHLLDVASSAREARGHIHIVQRVRPIRLERASLMARVDSDRLARLVRARQMCFACQVDPVSSAPFRNGWASWSLADVQGGPE